MGVHQHFIFIWILWFNLAFSFSCNLILLYFSLVENVSTYYQHHINSDAVSRNILTRVRAYISYIIYLLVDKACCTTQCHDLPRGSIVSMHNMSQRQGTVTFPVAAACGIFGAHPQRGGDASTTYWVLAPALVLIWEYVPSPKNWYSHVSRASLCMNKGLCVHRSVFPSQVSYRCWNSPTVQYLLPEGFQKSCNISRRTEYSCCSISTSTALLRGKLKPGRLGLYHEGHFPGSGERTGLPQSFHHQLLFVHIWENKGRRWLFKSLF